MAIMSSKFDNNECLTITVRGRFDYHCIGKFRYHYESKDDRPKTYVVDLTQTESIDSTAIGLLLMLKNRVTRDDGVILKNPNEIVYKVLNISRLDQMFTIQSNEHN